MNPCIVYVNLHRIIHKFSPKAVVCFPCVVSLFSNRYNIIYRCISIKLVPLNFNDVPKKNPKRAEGERK